MKALGQIKSYRMDGSVTFQVEYTTRNALGVDTPLLPGAEVVDARTVRFSGKDFMETWTRAKM